MDYSKIIKIEPGKRSGKPTIRGTRMTVTDVLEYLAGGMSEEEILADFPDLTKEDIKACLAFAADTFDYKLNLLLLSPRLTQIDYFHRRNHSTSRRSRRQNLAQGKRSGTK